MLLPEIFHKSIVLFKKKDKPVGSGFLLAFYDSQSKSYEVYVCTCRHVVDSEIDSARVNLKGAEAKEYPINKTRFLYHSDPTIDLTISPINVNLLEKDVADVYCITEENMLSLNSEEWKSFCIGDAVFILGFPLAISGIKKNYPIARGGIIARKDSEIIKTEKSFLIDCQIFGGNSGGPVFSKPESFSLAPTGPITKSYCLGIVSSVIISYTDAVDPNNNRLLVRFPETTGLANVVPIYFAKEIFIEYKKKLQEEKVQHNTETKLEPAK